MKAVARESAASPLLRSLRLAVLVTAATILFSVSVALVRNWSTYQPWWQQIVAYFSFALIAMIEAPLARRELRWGFSRWPTITVVLAMSALSTFTLPQSAVTSAADWSFGTTGWLLLILVADQPLIWLIVLLTAQVGIQFGAVLHAGAAGRGEYLNAISGSLGAIGYPLACGIATSVMRRVVDRAQHAARLTEQLRTDDEVSARLHAHQQERFADLDSTALPLLRGLAQDILDPTDAAVQRACTIEAARMRRLFAEVDQSPTQLLHELRHCVDVAERRGVVVELETSGQWRDPPRIIRRKLTDGPLTALATARTWARVTIVGSSESLTVTVVADAYRVEMCSSSPIDLNVVHDGNLLLVEATWKVQR